MYSTANLHYSTVKYKEFVIKLYFIVEFCQTTHMLAANDTKTS